MCGIFGYIGKRGRGPDLARLRRIAIETETRGRHAFGLAWLDRDGGLHTYKRPGAASASLADLDRVRDAAIVVGHCRWATHGSPSDNRNNHPHPAGRGWLVHNGVVHNHQRLARDYQLETTTQCDSEVLGLLLARMAGPIDLRAARTAAAADGPLAILGVWAKPARLLVVRRGKPLCVGDTDDGSYFGSLAGELPGLTAEIPDGYSGLLSLAGGRIKECGVAIGR
jgi:glucosamine 6-phosphate synthetase-like amidotransferase/phosphosugar isomerase protein